MPSLRPQCQVVWLQGGAFKHYAENTLRRREQHAVEPRTEMLRAPEGAKGWRPVYSWGEQPGQRGPSLP